MIMPNPAQDWFLFIMMNDNIPPVPPGSEIRITEDSSTRETEDDFVRVTE